METEATAISKCDVQFNNLQSHLTSNFSKLQIEFYFNNLFVSSFNAFGSFNSRYDVTHNRNAGGIICCS